MEWTESIKRAIDYMETHLLEDINADDVAYKLNISSFYLQKGFKFMTDYSMGEYLRNRRLYLSGLDIIAGKEKVIDLAYKYGYDTPESFTKAFKRFHGISPMQLQKVPNQLKTFLPLKIVVSIQGGESMDYVVEKMPSFKFIGFTKEFSVETSYNEIPIYWNEICSKYFTPFMNKREPQNEIEEAISNNHIGEYGVCIEGPDANGKFIYMIAGIYKGGNVPNGLEIHELPAMEWAKFSCTGPMPGALQSVNTKIFKEWLPNNLEYEIAMGANLEWYSSEGNTTDIDYKSAIWIPVKRKK